MITRNHNIYLIDMNAQLYDPMLGHFLSPDPHIQSPDCPQNYNSYTYYLNNPLRYTDPTGEDWIQKRIFKVLSNLSLILN